MARGRSLERADIGAWVLKANPGIYDVGAAIASGDVPFHSWRLAPSYRLELIAPGDKALLWVTGANRGVYAAGLVVDLPEVAQGGTRYWKDLDEKNKVRPYLPVDLRPIPKLAEVTLLQDPRFREAEVVRVRQMSNPSYLTPAQCDAVRELIEPALLFPIGWD